LKRIASRVEYEGSIATVRIDEFRYADGSTKQLRTGGAEDTDPALQNLVTAVIDSEPWYPDRGGAPRGGRAG